MAEEKNLCMADGTRMLPVEEQRRILKALLDGLAPQNLPPLELWAQLLKHKTIWPLLSGTQVLFTGPLDRGWRVQQFVNFPCTVVWDAKQRWLNWQGDWQCIAPPDNGADDLRRYVVQIVAFSLPVQSAYGPDVVRN